MFIENENTGATPSSRLRNPHLGILRRKATNASLPKSFEWPGIMAHGDTCEEAASQIQLALEGALEVPPNKASNRRRLRSHIPRERRGSMLVHKRRMERLG